MQGWIQRDVAVDLFKHAGLDFDAEKEKAKSPDFHPVAMTGAGFSADYPVKTEHVTTHNVLAILPGSVHPDETIVYSAHWDHFGVGKPDATGDRIYHGADDDGTGDAGVLELARAFEAGPRPQRSIVFALWTAEERGLLGSEYYAAHPLYPLSKTVANINMDVLQTAGPAHDVILVGTGQDTLEDMLNAAAKAHGRYVTPESHPEVGSFYRGDQFSFALVGVPVLPLMADRAAAPIWCRAAARRARPGPRISPNTTTTRPRTAGARAGICAAPRPTSTSPTTWARHSPIRGSGRRGSRGRSSRRRAQNPPGLRR